MGDSETLKNLWLSMIPLPSLIHITSPFDLFTTSPPHLRGLSWKVVAVGQDNESGAKRIADCFSSFVLRLDAVTVASGSAAT
jgi:hypothetical protein